MTNGKLHLILDDDSRKLTLNELQEIIYQLKLDVYGEALKFDTNNWKHQYYMGEENAFHICLMLLTHLKEGD